MGVVVVWCIDSLRWYWNWEGGVRIVLNL